MKQTPNTRDTFFYFFALYSSLFIILDYVWALIVLQVITYLALLIYFCYKLNSYFSYLLDNKKIADQKKKSKSEKEVTMKYEEVKETFKEGVIILGLTVCFFVAVWNTDRYLENTSQEFIENNSITSNLSEVWLANINEPEIVGTPNLEVINDDYTDINIPVDSQDTTDIDPVLAILDSKIDEPPIDREVSSINWEKIQAVEQDVIAMDTSRQSSGDSLSLDKNFGVQIKDVYALEAFTKEWSWFFNTMQLQKVLQRLWYFTGLPDGTFTFETKMAIYNALVTECGWPAESTTWVFWKQAKVCLDNLYITSDQSLDGLYKESFEG